MSSTLFIIHLAIDWITKNTTSDIPRGIRWGTFMTLEDLALDDIALFSHSHQHIRDETNRLQNLTGSTGPKISMTLNVRVQVA